MEQVNKQDLIDLPDVRVSSLGFDEHVAQSRAGRAHFKYEAHHSEEVIAVVVQYGDVADQRQCVVEGEVCVEVAKDGVRAEQCQALHEEEPHRDQHEEVGVLRLGHHHIAMQFELVQQTPQSARGGAGAEHATDERQLPEDLLSPLEISKGFEEDGHHATEESDSGEEDDACADDIFLSIQCGKIAASDKLVDQRVHRNSEWNTTIRRREGNKQDKRSTRYDWPSPGTVARELTLPGWSSIKLRARASQLAALQRRLSSG